MVARVALQRNDVELVAVNDPFITTDYMVCYSSLQLSCLFLQTIADPFCDLLDFEWSFVSLFGGVDLHVQVRQCSWPVEASRCEGQGF